MKNTLKTGIILLVLFSSCKSKDNTKYASFGEVISAEKTLQKIAAFQQMKGLKKGDTIQLKFTSSISDLCTSKGCWMKLPMNDSVKTMVKFKDYGFFMPLDAKGKKVIVEGKSFVKETSVEELRHYAEDAGKPAKEIAKIVESKKEYIFEASGVLLAK